MAEPRSREDCSCDPLILASPGWQRIACKADPVRCVPFLHVTAQCVLTKVPVDPPFHPCLVYVTQLQGKTVEVGRAHFETAKKRYTILDAPGHKARLLAAR